MQSTESSFENIRKDFPILKRTVRDNKPLVYLDNASTTQKPNQVIDAITDYYQNHNANIHRAVYALAEESTEAYESARDKIANFVNVKNRQEIIFDNKKIINNAHSNFAELKKLVWNKKLNVLGKFLIARMLYADGLNAIIVMGGIFAVGVFNLEIKELLKLSVLMNVTAFIGAFMGGVANDRFGSKIVIIFSLVGLIFSSIAILFIYSKSAFFFLAAINGLFIGPVQSASRVVITSLLNKNNQGKGFGLFATSGKLTSFLGPLLVSTVTFLTNSQRIGFSAAIILLLAGLIILLNIKKIS